MEWIFQSFMIYNQEAEKGSSLPFYCYRSKFNLNYAGVVYFAEGTTIFGSIQ